MARNSTPLKVVGKADEKNKSAALDAALSQIDPKARRRRGLY